MSTTDLHAASLSDLYDRLHESLSDEAFAAELDARLHDGRADEARTFLRGCEERCLNILGHLSGSDAPWSRDGDRWLAFARLTVPRGHVLSGRSEVLTNAHVAAEVRVLAEQWLAHARSADLPVYKGIGLVLGSLLPWLSYPGMPYDEVTSTLDWALALREEAGFRRSHEYHAAWKPLVAQLNDADLQRYAAVGGKLFDDVLDHYRNERQPRQPKGQGWKDWLPFFAEHPQLFDKSYIDDPDLIGQRWASAGAPRREELAALLLSQLTYSQRAERTSALQLLDRLVAEDSAPFAKQLRENGRYQISLALAMHAMKQDDAALLPLLLPAMAQRCDREDELRRYRSVIRELVTRRPADLAEVPVKDLVNVLPVLDTASLKAALPALTAIITGSSAKGLRAAMAGLAAHIPLASLVDAGWLNKPPKNLLLTCRDVLLAHPDPAVGPLLAQLLAGGKLDAASASSVQQRLQQLGLTGQGASTSDESQADAASPASAAGGVDLEAQLASIKRLSAAIKPFDTPELLALCAPLSEHAARVLLHVSAIAEGGLPPLAGELLARIPADNRARLALALVQQWIASEGEPKQRWALRLLPGHADDRVVDALVSAVQAWNRPRLQRAAAAVEHLGEVDSLYALLRVQEISESRSLKDQVQRTARIALRAAAARRKMSVPELFDELTPDFGLGQGLTVTVGPQSYRVELQGDLSLRVINDKNKASKTIPAVKDEALKPEWEAATAQLKTLTTSLKTVVKQQAPRMLAALVSGKRWPLDRWQRLFVAHPLLRIVGRSLIWRAEDAPGLARTSFRLAEDFSLVDVEDETVTLPAGCSISLWHPATAQPGEREAWQAYMADYELEPLVDQLGACAEQPAPGQFKNGMLLPPAPITLAQEQLGGLLKKFGYRPGPVGDGPSINEHVWRLPALELNLELSHGYFPPYLDLGLPVAVEGLRVHDLSKEYGASADPARLPKPLLATLQGQWLALAAKAAA
ncbi:DUF4132 domain-containing protein [Delftia sp. SD018]|uniref:DUF4132 domain-containing protein n=1 Tax=unclassified Delftia TaxID=2613839 RepID=UPI001A976A3E|nr:MULTISPECIES: DUF4132 domain-containing protein [unclassified Delftia]MBO0987871.1 DUF4132 domain-containing protein [Delftia sp. SD083]MBO1034330.1 DUF4132 domain-containing protein [Delftia sp. SD018]